MIGISARAGVAGPIAHRGAVYLFLLSPLMVPGIVLGLALLLVLAPLQLTASCSGLVAAHLVITLLCAVRTSATNLLTLSPLDEEAALSLGAGAAIALLVSFDER